MIERPDGVMPSADLFGYSRHSLRHSQNGESTARRPEVPMFLSPREAHDICERLISKSRADACEIQLRGAEEETLRFAGGGVTNQSAARISLRISSHIGGRVGSVEISSLEQEAGLRALARSEEIARELPPDPDYAPPLGPQNYLASQRYFETTAALRLDAHAAWAESVMAEGARRNVQAFGCSGGGRRFLALANSAGLSAYDKETEAEISVTARTRADDWSGWAGENALCASRLAVGEAARRACEKAAQAAAPHDVEPGDYTVIFEPAATAELAWWILHALDLRAAEEGRSFFSKKGVGDLRGELLFDEKFTLRSDPADALAPQSPIGAEGLPQQPRAWVDKGALASLFCDRAYAQKRGVEPVPPPHSFSVGGGTASLDDMIRATRRGLLVTRIWYANMLDPRSLLLTGLTRDGNFVIENGRIVAPGRNLRFNASLGDLFARISALGPARRTWAALGQSVAAAPTMLIERFPFSSKSGGI
jgi:predicted Zn-dependent protease